MGYFGKVCRKKHVILSNDKKRTYGSSNSSSPNQRSARSIKIGDIFDTSSLRRAPTVGVTVSSHTGSSKISGRLHFTPDTGAETTAMGPLQLQQVGFQEPYLSLLLAEPLGEDVLLLTTAS